MSTDSSLGNVTILGQTYPVRHSSLVLTSKKQGSEEFSELSIEADDGTPDGWLFRIDCMPVEDAHSLEDLIDGRVHFECTSEPADDDTFGSDPNELVETSGLFLGDDDALMWGFEAMQIDFEHLGDFRFRLRIECTLFNWDDLDKYTKAKADFVVQAKAQPSR